MLLSPRYDGPPILRIDLPMGDPAVPLVKQRRRLAGVVTGFEPEQWAAPSRCEGWSALDVLIHLVSTNQFWAISMGSALAGEPTRFLANFDPVTSPAHLVASSRATAEPLDVLARFMDSTDAMAATVNGLDAGAWSAVVGEAPPGHVQLGAIAAHALWDSWVHERDILLPLGIDQRVKDDEVVTCLRYAAALGLAFQASKGSTRRGSLVVEATDPDVRFVVEAGETVVVHDGDPVDGREAAVLRGRAVDLLEGLSFRTPLEHDLGPEQQWLLGGLDEVFDRV